MPRIQVLPTNIANMIAAGEVVQRPASVVKELMENAVDAGATNVTVVITDAGRTLIQVIDNGCGMSREEATLCFERHATSKITTAEDLTNILTYGFRGEALASIAAVSEVTLRTRRAEDEAATEIYTSGDSRTVSETAAPVGSNFMVRNIFYNVPARRKFLKTDNVELKHIVDEFTHIALTRPEVGFSLSHNSRDIYVLKPAKSLKYRIQDLLGAGLASEMVDIDTATSIARITGFIGRPDTAKKGLGTQFLFVNNRYFRSPYLHKAIMKAYQEFIPEGVTPAYFIYFDVDPQTIDVNIHPTKTEIKFEEDSILFQILYACVKEVLGRNSFGASIDFDAESAVQLPVIGKNFEEYHPISAPVIECDPTYNPFETPQFGNTIDHFEKERPQDCSKLFEDQPLSSPTRVITVQGKYIAVPASSGIMLVNIRRAQERIIFDRFLNAISRNEHVTQTALLPVQVKVGVQSRLLIDDSADLLEKLGFDISPFGTDTIVVNGVPEGISCDEGHVEQMINQLLLILSDDKSLLEEAMTAELARQMAALSVSTAKTVTSPAEAQKLIDKLLSCENAEFTANGKRIISILTIDEIEKRF
ncbi:MAG: DNA mismatch repair endonuclease MutL [Bacteroidales bacterium]|nr:DNA mismatch repair endonuclease MutL [Bacteroidales bacterium]